MKKCETYAFIEMDEKERMIRCYEQPPLLEEPFFLDEEQILFVRTVRNTPEIYTPEERKELKESYFIHESDYRSSLYPDYEKVLWRGLSLQPKRVHLLSKELSKHC